MFTPEAADGAGAAIAVNIAAKSAMYASAGAATGGLVIGTTIIGGIAYVCAKNFDWYEIDCSINDNVRNLKK